MSWSWKKRIWNDVREPQLASLLLPPHGDDVVLGHTSGHLQENQSETRTEKKKRRRTRLGRFLISNSGISFRHVTLTMTTTKKDLQEYSNNDPCGVRIWTPRERGDQRGSRGSPFFALSLVSQYRFSIHQHRTSGTCNCNYRLSVSSKWASQSLPPSASPPSLMLNLESFHNRREGNSTA